jgi:hypothetical protein
MPGGLGLISSNLKLNKPVITYIYSAMKHLIIILSLLYPAYLYLTNTVEQNATKVAGNKIMTPYTMIEEGQSLLKEGDLVVRLNRDPSSRFIKYFNRHDKSYSHAGIVLSDHGYLYVFHIVDGEENPDEKLRKDSLIRFCNPRKNTAYGIYRYNMSAAEISSLKGIVQKWYANGVRFDSAFSLASDDRMYCSEMVSKALTAATAGRIMSEPIPLTKVEASFLTGYTHLPFDYTSRLWIVPVDALYSNPSCHLIKRYNY